MVEAPPPTLERPAAQEPHPFFKALKIKPALRPSLSNATRPRAPPEPAPPTPPLPGYVKTDMTGGAGYIEVADSADGILKARGAQRLGRPNALDGRSVLLFWRNAAARLEPAAFFRRVGAPPRVVQAVGMLWRQRPGQPGRLGARPETSAPRLPPPRAQPRRGRRPPPATPHPAPRRRFWRTAGPSTGGGGASAARRSPGRG